MNSSILLNRIFFACGGKGLFLCLILWSTLGCGIPEYSYVTPPTVQSQNLAYDQAVFVTSADANAIEGYELYYKFYLDTTANELVSDKNEFLTDDSTGLSLIRDLGYVRAQQINKEGTPPLILISGDGHEILLNFLDMLTDPDSEPTVETSAGVDNNLPVTLGRVIDDPDNINKAKSFQDLNINLDQDLAELKALFDEDSDLAANPYITAGFAVIKRNLDINTLEVQYSEPQYLGTIDNLPYEY